MKLQAAIKRQKSKTLATAVGVDLDDTESEQDIDKLIPGLAENASVVIRLLDKGGVTVYFNQEDSVFVRRVQEATHFINGEELLTSLRILRRGLTKMRQQNLDDDESELEGDGDYGWGDGRETFLDFEDVNPDSMELCVVTPEISVLDLKDTPLNKLIRDQVLNEMTVMDAKALGIEKYLVLNKLKRK